MEAQLELPLLFRLETLASKLFAGGSSGRGAGRHHSREIIAMFPEIFAGEKTSGGYDVELTRAELKDSTLYVYYVEKNPASGGMAIQALTQPFHLAKLARHDGAVVFVKQSP